VALAFSAGAGLASPAPWTSGAAALLLLAVPIWLWRRPSPSPQAALILALLAGAGGMGLRQASLQSCPPADPGPVVLRGRLLAPTGTGSAPLVRSDAPGCTPERVWSDEVLPAGRPLELRGRWREGYGRGVIFVEEARRVTTDRPGPLAAVRWGLVRHRAAVQARADRLYGPRGGLVSALVLARREGLAPGTRTAFARTGIAHLLAISGFHVGVVAGLLLALARSAGTDGRRAVGVAAAGCWAYVAFLGFPEAACRAALILTLVGLAGARGRPSARWAPLGTALLLLVVADPLRVSSVGVQLSFLGAAGLLGWSRPLERRLRGALRRGVAALPVRPRRPGASKPGPVQRVASCVEGSTGPLAAGIAATAATLPVVAWHFEEVSLVGIPATLLASPLVALALPGALLTLILEPVLPGVAHFLAGGVDVVLAVLVEGTTRVARWDGASAWVPRVWTLAALLGATLAGVWARRRGLRAPARRLVAGMGALALVAAWPVLGTAVGRGHLEIRMLDVGQGDAVLLRTPRGRWILVDAGPPPTGRPGPVVEALVGAGVGRLELLVLTHPDADHLGEAAAILERIPVGSVLDPGLPVGKTGYEEVLEAALEADVPWRAATTAPPGWTVDGVRLRILHPRGPWEEPDTVEANDASVVLLLEYGAFEVLLPGDAPVRVERSVLEELPTGLEVLKAGHHGSRTSTDSLLVARTRPRLALVSAGRGNRYGHPAPEVVARLEGAGVRILRTDRHGTVRIQARADGEFRIRTGRR